MNTLKRLVGLTLAVLLSGPLEARSCAPAFFPQIKPLVQVAILLDTSNSMDGLIEQAKSQIWRVANDLAYATRCGERPRLEIALFEYGNNRLSSGENYIRQVLPFTTDLDLVSEKLFALRTNGGQEYCGAVLKDAVQTLRWNERAEVYKAIFIAGNEPFTQGPVWFRDSVSQAIRKGIRVNTIFCGNYTEGVQTQWQEGAVMGQGAYLTIDQNHVVVVDPTPYDDEISRLGSRLNETYVGYGAEGRQAMANKARVDSLAASLPSASGAVMERSLLKAAPQAASPSWDVVSAVGKGEKSVADLKQKDLPAEWQAKSSAELESHIKEQYAKREVMQNRLGELKKQRDEFLTKRQKATGTGAALSLDEAMRQTVRRQAGALEFKFDVPKP